MNSHQPKIKRHDLGDTALTYLDYGGQAEPLVMLHATGFLPWLWHPLALPLSSRYRVIVPALYDHRPRDPHQGGLPWMQLAEDVKTLCVDLGIQNSILVGHSMGGAVAAMAHAVQGLPAARLVLIEPIFLPAEMYSLAITVDQHPLAAKAIKRRNQWRDREEARLDFKSKPFFQKWDREVLDLYVAHGLTDDGRGGVRLSCPPLQEAALFIGGSHFNPWPVLPSIACPTLVVEGERSENRPWIDLPRVSGLIPGGHYAMMNDAGHLVPMEKPMETRRLIEAFLRGVPPAADGIKP